MIVKLMRVVSNINMVIRIVNNISFMKYTENIKISFTLFILFLISYSLLIPFYTSKPDVIVFALRSLADNPIFDIAYLNANTYLSGEPLPNYHLGHTFVLWLAYNIFPQNLAETIWPSGFISAVSGALIVALTFLIWKKLGLNNKKSIVIAVVVGLIPSFIEESIIGEVYALQFLFILLFIYNFLSEKLVLSSIFFLFACLVSPLSGLAFGLIFLKERNKSTLLKAFGVGAFAFMTYIIIYLLVGSNLLNLLNPSSQQPDGRGILYRLIALVFFIGINFNFFLIYLAKGTKAALTNEKKYFIPLLVGTTPQLILLLAGSTFFIELGSFQLPVFWALAFPLGIYLSEINYKSILPWSALALSLILSYFLWINPNTIKGSARENAGIWLKNNGYNNISVIGPWSVGVSILKGREGSNIDSLNNYYLNKPCPEDADLLKTNEVSLIIAEAKKDPIRLAVSKLGIPGLNITLYDPVKEISIGKTKKLYENDYVSLYQWNKTDSLRFVNNSTSLIDYKESK